MNNALWIGELESVFDLLADWEFLTDHEKKGLLIHIGKTLNRLFRLPDHRPHTVEQLIFRGFIFSITNVCHLVEMGGFDCETAAAHVYEYAAHALNIALNDRRD